MDQLQQPELFNIKNKENFKTMLYSLNLYILRGEVFELLLRRKNEEDYFDLAVFHTTYPSNELTLLTNTIMDELKELGWYCTLAFGNRGLYIHSTEKPPSTCW